MPNTSLTEICEPFSSQKLPRWEELPDLELYMDQVLSLISRYLGNYPGFDGKGLTASMVNNYVKAGVVPGPSRKKYNRSHLAHLMIVCILKPSLPLDAIRQLLVSECSSDSGEQFYDHFCTMFEQSTAESASSCLSAGEDTSLTDSLCRAALRAQAEQALAGKLFSSAFPSDS